MIIISCVFVLCFNLVNTKFTHFWLKKPQTTQLPLWGNVFPCSLSSSLRETEFILVTNILSK